MLSLKFVALLVGINYVEKTHLGITIVRVLVIKVISYYLNFVIAVMNGVTLGRLIARR